jgi:hypothetical protein
VVVGERKNTKSYGSSEGRSCLREYIPWESLGMRIQSNVFVFVFVFSLSHFYKQCVLLEYVNNNYR